MIREDLVHRFVEVLLILSNNGGRIYLPVSGMLVEVNELLHYPFETLVI